MSSFVHDPLTDRWILRAPQRAARPVGERASGCPFCPGNEAATPPTLWRLDRGEPSGSWRIRVFENLYPAVSPGSAPAAPLTRSGGATGAHEIVVTSPVHADSLADLDDDQVIAVVQTLVQRCTQHLDAGRSYVQAFVNHGVRAGASVPHPHAQVVALDVVPPTVTEEAARLGRGSCELCATVDGGRGVQVAANDGIVAISPDWAAAEGELVVLPAHHEPDVTVDDAHKAAAVLIRDLLAALRRAAEADVPYNLVLHTTGRGLPDFHWHLHLVPRTTTPGGFELGTGLLISQADPTAWAAAYRRALDVP